MKTRKWQADMASAPCVICDHVPLFAVNQGHHVFPKEFGGSDGKENRVPLCARCHTEIGHYKKHSLLRSFLDSGEDCWVFGNDKYVFFVVKSELVNNREWHDRQWRRTGVFDGIRSVIVQTANTAMSIYFDDKVSIFRQTLPWQAEAVGFPSQIMLSN